jgi:plasmid stabilization system protein ParE
MRSYRLLIRPEAESDLAAAYRWYEDKDAGLGEEFLRTVEASLLAVQKNPQAHQKSTEKSAERLQRDFPMGYFTASITTRFPSLVFCMRDAIRL